MNILIIGATSGIGYELWRYYAAKENLVAITGRRKDILDEMVNEYPKTLIHGNVTFPIYRHLK